MAASLGTIAGQVRLDVSQAIAAFGALRAATAAQSGALSNAGTRLSGFSKVALGAGIALGAAFAVAINKAADFEKKMDYFGAVNNATAADMEKVRATALRLGQTTQFSAGQIADAFVEMGKAGVSVADITGGLADAVVNLASAADIKLDEATNILTSQMQTYALKTSEAKHVTDLLAGAANASIVDVEDLGVSLKYVGGVAHALGISFDSTIDALSLLGKAGIKGSTAGTSLRQIMVSLAGGTDKAKGELEDLGIITKNGTNLFFDAHGKAKSLAEVFQILQEHTAGLSQKEQLMAFKTIFNNRALAAAEILTKAGAKGFAQMNSEIGKTTAADVAAKRLDNLSGDIQKMKGAIDTLLIKAGTPFQNFLRQIVQGLTAVIRWFASLPSGVQTGILTFIAIAAALLTVIGLFAMIGSTVIKFMATARELWGALKLLGGVIRTVALAMRALALTALTNPYVWIAIAVIALVAGLILLYQHSERFRAIMDAIGRSIKAGFLDVVNWFKGLPKWFADRWKEISHWFEVGVGWVKQNWDILLAIFTGPIGAVVLIWRRFGDTIVNFFSSLPGKIGGFISDAWNGLVNFLVNLPYYVGYAIGFVAGLIIRGLAIAGNAIYNWGLDALKWTIQFFSQLPGKVAGFFTDLYNNFINWSISFGVGIKNWAVSAYNDTVEWFSKLPARVAEFFINLWNGAQRIWNQFLAAAIAWVVNTYHSVVNWFQQLPTRVLEFLLSMQARAVGAFNSLVTTATNFGRNVYHAVIDFLVNLPSTVWNIINNVISTFNNMVSAAINAAKQFAKGLWDGFKNGLGIHSPSHIERAMWAITKVTDTETKRLGQHVRTMKSLAGQIDETNPAKVATAANTSRIAALTKSMQSQAALLQNATNSIVPSRAMAYSAIGASNGNNQMGAGTGLDAFQNQRPINVNVFNPVAERASDSTARKLRQLSDMGAL